MSQAQEPASNVYIVKYAAVRYTVAPYVVYKI